MFTPETDKNFEWALQQIKDGKAVRRKGWYFYIFAGKQDGQPTLLAKNPDDKMSRLWALDYADLIAED